MDNTSGASSAHRGEAAEHIVAADLLERGFTVSWPSSHAAYDLIAELPSGKLVRIQVKRAYFGVHTRDRPPVWMVHAAASDKKKRRYYPADAFEILAVVIGTDDGMLGDILYLPWFGQYRGQKIITEDMILEYQGFPCESSD